MSIPIHSIGLMIFAKIGQDEDGPVNFQKTLECIFAAMQRELFLSEVNNRVTIADNGMLCLQKRIEKFPLLYSLDCTSYIKVIFNNFCLENLSLNSFKKF